MRVFNNVDVIAWNLVGVDVALYQLSPAVVQIVVSRQITGEKQGDVAGIRLRLIIFDRGKVNLFDVPQDWRQRTAATVK